MKSSQALHSQCWLSSSPSSPGYASLCCAYCMTDCVKALVAISSGNRNSLMLKYLGSVPNMLSVTLLCFSSYCLNVFLIEHRQDKGVVTGTSNISLPRCSICSHSHSLRRHSSCVLANLICVIFTCRRPPPTLSAARYHMERPVLIIYAA